MTGCAAVGVQGEQQRRKDATLGGSSADGLGVRDMLPQPHELPSVSQEVRNPPAHGVRHIKLGELVTEQSWDDRIEGRAEVHKQYPGVGSSPGASGGPCLQHHLQICWLCR